MSTIRPSSIIYRPLSSAICCLLSVFCLRLSTIVERSLQIHPFLYKTNPIFLYFSPKTKISPKNKPNSNPIQSQSKPIFAQNQGWQTQTNPIFTLDSSSHCFPVGGQTQLAKRQKMNVSNCYAKIYNYKTAVRRNINKAKKTG